MVGTCSVCIYFICLLQVNNLLVLFWACVSVLPNWDLRVLLDVLLSRVSDRPLKLDVVTFWLNILDVHIFMHYVQKVHVESDHDCYERLKLSQRFVIDNTEILIYVRSNGNTIISFAAIFPVYKEQ